MKKSLLFFFLFILSLTGFGQTIQLTNGGSTTLSGSTGGAPISQYFEYMRFQVVYTAAELNAAGVVGPKTVTELGWYVSTAPANALPDYKIRMGNTTATNSAAHDVTSLTEVYNNAAYSPVAGGFNMLTLNGSFTWNGVDNLLVDVCFGAAVYASPYGEVRTYAASTSSGSRRVRCDACGSQCGANTSTTNTFKPQVSLTFGSPPTCVAPTGLTNSAITTTTASHSWTAATGSPLGYEWAVTTSATPPASGTATAGLTASSIGLTPGTPYYLHVRTSCAGATFSSWATSPFTTLITNDDCSGATVLAIGSGSCTPITATTAGATGSGTTPVPTCGAGSAGYDDDVWFTFTPGAGQTVMNLDFTSVSGNADMVAQIYTSSDNTCAGTFTAFACSDDDGPGSMPGFGPSTIPITVVPGTTYFVRVFTYSTAVSGAFTICAYTPPAPPACVTNISPANGATGVAISPNTPITWNAAAGATSYDVFFGTVNPPTANIGNIAATTANITGLQYDTTYYWYIVPKNTGGGAIGCNTNTTSFTALSAPPNCTPIYGTGASQNCSGGDVISLFRLKGESSELNINTGLSCNSPTAYVDSTDHPIVIDLTRGKSYWGQVQCGFSSNTIAIWIDFNDNGFFEVSEKLMNNLVVGTTLTPINIFIPLTATSGNHRMRVRNVFSPGTTIKPCDFYTYGETEDYLVNITSSGAPYTVSTYASAGACFTGAGDITIDALSNNNSNYVPLVDSNNALIAQLYPQGNNLGRVTTSYYKHNGAVRQDAGGRYYLDRNLTITVATQPTTPYNLRFPYQNTELNALIAQPGSGVTSQFDLVMTKNPNACLNAIGSGWTNVVFFPTGFGSISGDRFVDVTNITGGFSSFFLHSGSTPIPVKVEYFTGAKQGSNNLLDWKVSCTNTPNATLTLERSADSRNFASVYSITATALRCLQPFSYTDTRALPGMNYYRLKMTDASGVVTYSAIVALLNKDKGLEIVNITPNPVTEGTFKLNISSSNQIKMEVIITDIQGRVVQKNNVSLTAGFNALDMKVNNLAKGTYNIYGSTAEGNTRTLTFVKQ